MKRWPAVVLAATLSALPGLALAEPLPPPIGPLPSSAQADAGYPGDVENALSDFTRFQCDLLFFLTPRQNCPSD